MRGKKITLVLVFGFIFVLAGCTQQTQINKSSEEKKEETIISPDVTINNMSFSKDITIKAGQKVTWRNDDAIEHTVTFTAEEISSGPLRTGGIYERTFDAPGVYEYICDFHPMMKAKVTVE